MSKSRGSNFLVTISTNKVDYPEKKLKQAFAAWYKDLRNHIRFFEGNKSDLKSIKSESVIEVGEKYGRIHLHSLIKIDHGAKIHINLAKSRKTLGRLLGLEKFHFDVEYVKDNMQKVKDYLGKSKNAKLRSSDSGGSKERKSVPSKDSRRRKSVSEASESDEGGEASGDDESGEDDEGESDESEEDGESESEEDDEEQSE